MTSRMRPVVTLAAIFSASLLLSGVDVAEAGRKPADVFAGDIITSKKRLPTRARSARHFIKKIKKRSTDRFWEDEDKKRWKIYYGAFFRRPLNDLEVTIKLYDVTTGEKNLVSSFEQFLMRRGERSLVSHIKLDRNTVKPNRKILMVVENRGRALSSGTFRILGKTEKGSGTVDFTE